MWVAVVKVSVLLVICHVMLVVINHLTFDSPTFKQTVDIMFRPVNVFLGIIIAVFITVGVFIFTLCETLVVRPLLNIYHLIVYTLF